MTLTNQVIQRTDFSTQELFVYVQRINSCSRRLLSGFVCYAQMQLVVSLSELTTEQGE